MAEGVRIAGLLGQSLIGIIEPTGLDVALHIGIGVAVAVVTFFDDRGPRAISVERKGLRE